MTILAAIIAGAIWFGTMRLDYDSDDLYGGDVDDQD